MDEQNQEFIKGLINFYVNETVGVLNQEQIDEFVASIERLGLGAKYTNEIRKDYEWR